MDIRKLKTLIDLVTESGIAELEVTEGESRVRIIKSSAYTQNQITMPQHQFYTPPAAPSATSEVTAVVPTGYVLKSPMVGTFYQSASPGSSSFVEIGSSVKKGATLCIIEAMKLLNEIDTDMAGIVTKIMVKNGQPVEYGQPLFIIG
jgi:acetyl-CoA carboxylase biotin carboxyl carrier protein